jgi:hypothetical protein
MASPFSAAARELEALVARAARIGRLDPAELLPTYVRLMPGAHPQLASQRRLDLQGVTEALAMLPLGLLGAPAVRVVARLEAFDHEPVLGGSFSAGRLEDGTLIIEAGRGIMPLLNLTAPLCLLAHEAAKAQRLLEAAGFVQLTDDEPQPFGADTTGEPDDTLSIDSVPASDGAHEEAPEPEAADLAERVAEAEEEPLEAAANGPPLGEIAFHLGVDEAALVDADELTGGAVLLLLLGADPLPEILIHADLDPTAATQHAANEARHLLETLAENGLAGRPIHLWVGNDVITDCLSPYARELREVLLTWAAQNTEALDPEIAPLLDSPGEDLSYAVMHDFLRARDGLLDERARADRTAGILRSAGRALPFEIIDLGRVDASLCDARLPAWQIEPPAPVLVRLTADLEDDDAMAFSAVLEALRDQIAGVTLLLEGTLLGGAAGGILLPHLMVRWAGEEKLTVPAQTGLDPDELASLADVPVTAGAVLSVSSAALISPAHVSELARAFRVGAIEVGGAGLVAALADARWKGLLQPAVPVSWALVGARRVASGRPSVQTMAACAALAIATLRRIVGQPAQPKPAEPELPSRKTPSRRAMFIKA